MAVVIKENEPLAAHTVFRIGGPAERFIEASGRDDFVAALREATASGRPWFILGAGSNVLISDRGFAGTVIHPVGGEIHFSSNTAYADAAVSMARVVSESLGRGLCGFEWAIGVPGTIGGSVFGNAGCFGGEVKDVVEEVEIFNTATGAVETLPAEECGFDYRQSIFKRRPEIVILSTSLRLRPGDAEEGRRLVREYTGRRAGSQDIGSQSAGCIFKNIPWNRRGINPDALTGRFPELEVFRQNPAIPAGFLVDRAGLKGRRVGGAMVSWRHANFIINTGAATAEDVIMLIGLIKEHVHRRYGLILEEEIRYVGFDEH